VIDVLAAKTKAKAMIRALLLAVAVASLAVEAQAQQPKTPQPQQNVRCIKDSFGNYTCTDGTRVIHDSFDNPIVIPGRAGGAER
jgi:hypothetical protein